MASELSPIDIWQLPGLAQLVEEVRATGKPRRITFNNEDVAVLVPVTPKRPRPARHRPPHLSITEETAGIFKNYRLARPLTPREERDAFEQGVADEVAGTLGG
jgi:hypothetical protein